MTTAHRAMVVGMQLLLAVFCAPSVARAQGAGPRSGSGTQIGALLLPMPAGEISSSVGTSDTALAFGVAPFVDHFLVPAFSVGFSPQYIFNIKPDGATGSDEQLDLLLRLALWLPPLRDVNLFAFFAPGYSWVLMDQQNVRAPRGFVFQVGAGAAIAVSQRLSLLAQVSYQVGDQEGAVETAIGDMSFAYNTSFLQFGLGVAYGL